MTSIAMAETLREHNPALTAAERDLIGQWLEETNYGCKLRAHEEEHRSMIRQIQLARDMANIDSNKALWWAKLATGLAVAALVLVLGVTVSVIR